MMAKFGGIEGGSVAEPALTTDRWGGGTFNLPLVFSQAEDRT
jgi:hypothetical protein